MPKAVYVKFDDLEVDVGFGVGVVAVTPSKGPKRFVLYPGSHKARGADHSKAEVIMQRFQIPLMPETVKTVQTSQGMSMDVVKAFLAKGNHDDSEWWLNVYVMLSRATSMGGLNLWGMPPREFFSRGPPEYIKKGLPPLIARAEREMEESVARLSLQFPWLAKCAPDSVQTSSGNGCGGHGNPGKATLLGPVNVQRKVPSVEKPFVTPEPTTGAVRGPAGSSDGRVDVVPAGRPWSGLASLRPSKGDLAAYGR